MARRLGPDRSGATAVEFALLLPIMLAVLAGVLEFGRALWIRQDLQFAVEEAARYALVNDTASASAISAIATSRMATVGPASGGVTVTTTIAADSVTIVAAVDFSPILKGFVPDGLVTLSARARTPR